MGVDLDGAVAFSPVHAQVVDSLMHGTWFGTAEITVPWTVRRTLEVRLEIGANGQVSGMIGDALLVDGRIGLHARGIVSRALRLGREYEVVAALSGPLIADESIRRDTVRIWLDYKAQSFQGELQTSGVRDGTPADMILTARNVVLQSSRKRSRASRRKHRHIERGLSGLTSDNVLGSARHDSSRNSRRVGCGQ